MTSENTFSGGGSLQNSTGRAKSILPVDSWAYLEVIKRSLDQLKPKLASDREGLMLVLKAQEATEYLIEAGEKEAQEIEELVANLA